MSITSAQSYEMRISRSGDKITNPPQPYWQTVERLLTDRGVDHASYCRAPRPTPPSGGARVRARGSALAVAQSRVGNRKRSLNAS
jgi:hypothetical protein